MTADWCKECLEVAVNRFGKPEILNTDQGSQFSSPKFTGFVLGEDIRFVWLPRLPRIDSIW